MDDEFLAGVDQASREFDLPRPPLAAIGVDVPFEEGILGPAVVLPGPSTPLMRVPR
ncbi:MAG: hypothetical protein NTW05_23200 [Pseudonocardiales bacterium]|nr:hypothetical protein [Pseudonocardiales bacterium]